jgi:hypothetical protein
MKKYSPPAPKALELPNPAVLKTPTRPVEAADALSQLESKFKAQESIRSSPSRWTIDSTIWGTRAVLITSELTERELSSLTKRVQAQ